MIKTIKTSPYVKIGDAKIFQINGKERISLEDDKFVFVQVRDEGEKSQIINSNKWKKWKDCGTFEIDVPLDEKTENPRIIRVLENNQYYEKDEKTTFKAWNAKYFKRLK